MSQNTAATSNSRDQILMVITDASQIFLQGSLETWTQNVQQVLTDIGTKLGVKRVFMCKHASVTAESVVTSLRYEWRAGHDGMIIDTPGLQSIHLQEAGFARWAGILYSRQILHAQIGELPVTEQGWFVTPEVQRLIVVPVFVEDKWWGFIGFEDYELGGQCSQAELDAFKTLGIVFGAAIQRKHMEEAARRQQVSMEQKAREIADIAKFPDQDPSAVMRAAVGGVVLYANEPAKDLLSHFQLDLGGHVPEEWQQAINFAFAESHSIEIDIEVGTDLVALRFVPVPESHYVNIYSRDVTKERQVDQMKSEFISMASHQLRTPLTAIRWYSELLLGKAEGFSEKQVEMLTNIHQTGVQLAELIDDLLAISKFEKGTIEPEFQAIDLGALLDGCANDIQLQVDNHQQSLSRTFAGNDLSGLTSDPVLIKQIVMNLLSNASKYTPEGGTITLNAYKRDPQQILISVSDTGMGIPEVEKPKIFSRFFRTQIAQDSEIPGTGLGLSLVKMICETLGGDIWFESSEGQGTTFSLWIPLEPPQKKED